MYRRILEKKLVELSAQWSIMKALVPKRKDIVI